MLGQVVRLARAKKEGRLGEIEQFLRETTQLQEQEAHTAAVETEVAGMAPSLARGQSSFSLSNSPLRAMFSGNAEYRSEAERIALTERAAAELGGGQTFLPKRFVVRPADTHRLHAAELQKFARAAGLQDEYGPLLASAGEHAVFLRPGDAHVTKLTLPGFYGYVPVEDIATGSVADGAPFKRLHLEMATAAEYLHRTALFSREFGIPWKISHVEANDEGPLIA